MSNLKELLSPTSAGTFPETLILMGEDAFFEERIKLKLKGMGAELKSFRVPKTGLDAEMIEATQGGMLFSPLMAVILQFSASTSSWNAAAIRSLEEVIARADGTQLILIFQVPNDKRLKWDGLKTKMKLQLEEATYEDRIFWLQQLNKESGGSLDKSRIEFLASFEEDLLGLKNAVELWNLGGDDWAVDNLSWSSASTKGPQDQKIAGGAFDWADLLLGKRLKDSQKLLSELLGQGEDPFKLLGLIGKSARILAMLEMKKNVSGQAPFLIQKLKKVSTSSHLLLNLCKEADLFMKSSSVNAKAMLQRLRL